VLPLVAISDVLMMLCMMMIVMMIMMVIMMMIMMMIMIMIMMMIRVMIFNRLLIDTFKPGRGGPLVSCPLKMVQIGLPEKVRGKSPWREAYDFFLFNNKS